MNEQDKERNDRLARAMGLEILRDGKPFLWWNSLTDRNYHNQEGAPPDFHADTPYGHWWKAKLLEWKVAWERDSSPHPSLTETTNHRRIRSNG